MIICFNGIDGSGKSYQAQRLVDQLNAASCPAVHVWTGGKRIFRRPLIALGKRMLRKRSSKAQASSYRGTPKDHSYTTYLDSTQRLLKRPLLRNIWQHLSLLEHTLEIWFTVLPPLLRGQVVIADRYLHDSVVRLAVLEGLSEGELLNRLASLRRYRVPQPTLNIMIDVSAEVAFGRKDDIPAIEYLQRRIPLYRAAAHILGWRIVDGTNSPEEVAEAVWHHIQPLLPMVSPTTHLSDQHIRG